MDIRQDSETSEILIHCFESLQYSHRKSCKKKKFIHIWLTEQLSTKNQGENVQRIYATENLNKRKG